MIATLTGTLVETYSDGAIIDVNGVGYRVFMTSSSIARLPSRGAELRVQTHLHVREDAMTLFAFQTSDERELFEVLITVNGIGPRNALAILSAHAPLALRRAVVSEDVDALTTVPGIGKKTAARLVLELKEKLSLPDLSIVAGAQDRAKLAEVRDALLQLGYTTTEAREAVDRIDLDGEQASTEDLLRTALKELAAR